MNDLTYFALRNRARAVSEWLDGLERTSAAPVLVTIGRTTYAGAEYRQTRDHDPSTRAYRDGERTYVLHAIYLLGELPSSYRHGHARAYIDADTDAESGARWYVGGWWRPEDFQSRAYVREADGSTRPQTIEDVQSYHPFGANWSLHPDTFGVTRTGAYGQPVIDRVRPMSIERVPTFAPSSRA
jgi:hypothetical protein